MTDIRTGEPPIDILTRLLETDPEFMKQAEARGVYSPLPPAKLLRDLRRRWLAPIYFPFQIRPSSGFGASSGISQIPPIFPAPGTRPCLQS